MCAIIGWHGSLPKGLLTQLLLKSSVRGKDSTGIAFRAGTTNYSYRQVAAPKAFVKDPTTNQVMSEARKAVVGLGHTRRASPGMPIDEINAHPFAYWQYLFAHNGKISNWREVKQGLVEHFEREKRRLSAENKTESAKRAAQCGEYASKITTDSMVLGPYIHARDFESIEGCMSVIWMRGPNLYVLRHNKEAVAAKIVWRYTTPTDDTADASDHRLLSIVASTPEIIKDAINGLDAHIEIEYTLVELAENRIYQIGITDILDEGPVPTSQTVIEDQFSSEIVA